MAVKCDWCWHTHETVPVAIGNSHTGEIADANLCRDSLQIIATYYSRYKGTGNIYITLGAREFSFDMWEA